MARVDHEWTSPQPHLRALHPQLPPRGALQLGRRAATASTITRGGTDRFNYNVAVGHTAVLSPSLFLDVKGSFLRFNDDLRRRYATARPGRRSATPSEHAGPARRLRAHSRCSASSRASPATTAGARGARSAASRTASTPAASSRSTTCSSRRRSPERAAPTPSRPATTGAACGRTRSTRAGAAAPTRFDSTLHARARQRRRPLRPGRRRRSCSACRPTTRSSRLRPESGLRGRQPRLLHPRRLARRRSPHAERRRALRPRAGHDREPEPQHARLRLHHRQPDPGGRARRATRRLRRRACR